MDKKLQEKMADANILCLHSRIDDEYVNGIVVHLMSIAEQDPKAEIQMLITGGLEFGRAMPIYDAIRAIPNPVFGIGFGHIGEFCVLLLASCSRRAMLPHAYLRIDEAYGVLDAGGNQQTEVLIAAKEAEGEQKVYEELLAKHTHHTVEEIKAFVEDERRFLPDEALKLGFIDEIIGGK